MIKNKFLIPNLEALVTKVARGKISSKIDLAQAYYQIRVKESSKSKTEFSLPDGHYHWKVMPFGLSNAPATFQKFINSLFRNIPNIQYYLYDIIIVYSGTIEQHTQDLKTGF